MSQQWKNETDRLSREFEFDSFPDAMSFMLLISYEIEKLDHHPEWKNIYNKVFVELTTHTENGITEKDHILAKKMDEQFSKFK